MSYTNNNHNNNYDNGYEYIPYEQFDYKFVMERRQNRQYINSVGISTAITKEVKINRNYRHGEELFEILRDYLYAKEYQKPGHRYTEKEIGSFQRSVGTMVRYAPNPNKARYYTCLVLDKYEQPFRTATLELNLFTNLIYVYSTGYNENNMMEALNIVKLAMEIGAFEIEYKKDQSNERFNDPLDVFETVARKVLKFHKLDFNQDRTELITSTRQFSH